MIRGRLVASVAIAILVAVAVAAVLGGTVQPVARMTMAASIAVVGGATATMVGSQRLRRPLMIPLGIVVATLMLATPFIARDGRALAYVGSVLVIVGGNLRSLPRLRAALARHPGAALCAIGVYVMAVALTRGDALSPRRVPSGSPPSASAGR